MGRYRAYHPALLAVGMKSKVDLLLLKALAWKESEFDAQKVGPGEGRGLLQVKAPMARDWAAAEHIETMMLTDLFDARTNLEIGAWALARALERWKAKDQPEAWALAEFKLGRERAEGWQGDSATRDFVDEVLRRRDFYQRYGW